MDLLIILSCNVFEAQQETGLGHREQLGLSAPDTAHHGCPPFVRTSLQPDGVSPFNLPIKSRNVFAIR